MDRQQSDQITELLGHVLQTARANADAARQVRDALLASGILEVFDLARPADAAGVIDLLDLLEAGGPEALRARLEQLSAPDLHQIIAAHQYDPKKETGRWRTVARLAPFIVERATHELEAERAGDEPALAGTAWLL